MFTTCKNYAKINTDGAAGLLPYPRNLNGRLVLLLRLDKLLSSAGVASRTESARAAARGEITVNGTAVRRADLHIDPEQDTVVFRGEEVRWKEFTFVMLNKPQGYVCSTEDPRERPVTELLPERLQKVGLFPCGRLDKDTTGLVILTNDGQLAHRMLSPRHHVAKVYRYECADPLSEEAAEAMRRGMTLADGTVTKEAAVTPETPTCGTITLTEGKYHEIKRMFGAVGNRITSLERIAFAGIPLDSSLARGEWRFLTEEEESLLRSQT